MKRLKIMFDANPLIRHKSGVGYFTQELILQMAKFLDKKVMIHGYYFNFLKRKPVTDLPKSPNLQYVENAFIPGKFLNIARRFGFQLPLEFFTRQRSDVVLYTNFVALPLITSAVKVVTVHDLCFVDCPEFVAEKNASFLQRWVPASVQKADVVLTISEFTKKRIVKMYGITPSKVHVMPIPPQTPANPDQKILTKHSLKENTYILFVGTIEPRKNIIGLLHAYAMLPDTLKNNYPLVLVGGKGWNDTEIMSALEELRQEKLNIIQTGYVTDSEKAALYEGASIVVQPSHYEGFGMPILEAMSYGKPVLCSDIEVFHEVGGNAPVFFDKDSTPDIATSIANVLGSPVQMSQLSAQSKARVRAFPDWSQVVQSFYNRLLQ